jgi:MtN3 and saliva related transmembrane protein
VTVPTLLQIIGWFATVVSVVSLMPQVWKTWRSRSAHDISVSWLTMAFFGAGGWVAYGVLLPAPEVMITNAAIAFLVGILLAMKAWFRGKPED